MPSKVTLGDELLFPSTYLSHADCFGKDIVLTIARVEKEELTFVGGKKKVKPVVYFAEEHAKPLVINKTNADSIAHLYGTKAEDWIGKKVRFYPTKVPFGRDIVDAIRVREDKPPDKPKTITRAQGAKLTELLKQAGVDPQEFFKTHGVKRLGEILESHYQAVADGLAKVIEDKKPTEPDNTVSQWQEYAKSATLEAMNDGGLAEIKDLPKQEHAQVWSLVKAEMEIRGFKWDEQAGKFTA